MNLAVAVVYLMGVLAVGMVVRLIPGAPALQAELGASSAQMGLIIGLIGLPGLLGPFVGVLSDRMGPGRLMLAAGLAASAASLFLTVAPNIDVVLAVRLLEGVTFIAMMTAAPVLLLRLTHGKAQVAAMGLWSTVAPVGSAFAFFLAGLLGTASWRALFVTYAAMFGVLAVAAYLLTREKVQDLPGTQRPPFRVSTLLRAYADVTLVRFALAFLLVSVVGLGLVTVFPQVAAAFLGWTRGSSTQILAASNLAVIPGAAIGAFLLSKTGAFRSLIAAIGLLLVLCFAVLYSPLMSGPVVTAAIFFQFFLQGAAGTIVMAALPRLVPPERQGLAMGVVGQFASSGVLIAAPVWLLMWERGGGLALTICAGTTSLLFVLAFPAPARPPRLADDAPVTKGL